MKKIIILFIITLLFLYSIIGCYNAKEQGDILDKLSSNLRENYGTGKDVNIAVIDSGASSDYIGKNSFDFTDEDSVIDTINHGVPIINIIADKEFGIAPDATIYSLKVINKYGNASTQSLQKALQWCLDSNIDIINMSLSFGLYNENLECIISELIDKGVIVVASISNDEISLDYPSMYKGVICVGKTNLPELYNKERCIIFESINFVKSVGTDKNIKEYRGNSFLAPLVTGTLACVIEKNNTERRKTDEELVQTVKNIFLKSDIDIK